MNQNEAFLRKLASEIATLRMWAATLQEFLIRLGVSPDELAQARSLALNSPDYREVAEEVFQRLQ